MPNVESQVSYSRREFMRTGAGVVGAVTASRALMPFPASAAGGSQAIGASDGRLTFSFDSDWLFCRPGDNAANQLIPAAAQVDLAELAAVRWEEVSLPHSARLERKDVGGGLNYQGISWYKRSFTVPPEWNDRVLLVTFEGAMMVADIWLNGRFVTTHYGGYLPFTLNITGLASRSNANQLLVRLNNIDNPEVPPGRPLKRLDFIYHAGLYRSASFEVLDPLHISNTYLANKKAGGGIFVTYPQVAASVARVKVQTDVANESSHDRTCFVRHTLADRRGAIVATGRSRVDVAPNSSAVTTRELQVHNPSLWHPDDPHLYELRTTIEENGRTVDGEHRRIGIRSIHFDKEGGLTLNGKPFFSIGANRHQDHPYVGYALPASAHYRDAYKLRDAGFTSCRSHYPQDPSFMDACDELGILNIVSNPGWQFVGDDVFKERAYQNCREMIRRDRNRPSVIMWEAALNEANNKSVAADLYQIVHEEYPGPECYTSGEAMPPVGSFQSWDVVYAQWHGEERGYSRSDNVRAWWIREWGDSVDNWTDQQGPVRVARDWGEGPMLVQTAKHIFKLNQILSREKPAGTNLWVGIDYPRGYNHQPMLGGVLDLFRLPKLDYYMFQSQRPPQLTPAGLGSGPVVFIANYATFYSPQAVTVFSNCEQVRLFLNGKELATQRPDTGHALPHPPFTFKASNVNLEQTMLFSTGVAPAGAVTGELRAEGLIDGKVVATHIQRSPGVPSRIELVLDQCGREPVADGADWLRVYAHIRDSRGTTHPYSDDEVTFSVSGEGSLIGDAAISANPVRAEAGIATALVRMSAKAGTVVVRASAPGLTDGEVRFASKHSTARLLT